MIRINGGADIPIRVRSRVVEINITTTISVIVTIATTNGETFARFTPVLYMGIKGEYPLNNPLKSYL